MDSDMYLEYFLDNEGISAEGPVTTRSPDLAHLMVPAYFATGTGVAHRLEKLRAAKESMTVRKLVLCL